MRAGLATVSWAGRDRVQGRPDFDEVAELAFQHEGQDVEIYAAEGEDV